MKNNGQREYAEAAYREGKALFQEGRFAEAMAALRTAEDLFRQLDAIGHPFNYTFENGISGLANTLHLLGRCHARAGDLPEAIKALETSLINERFERALPLRAFRREVTKDLGDCYERVLAGGRPEEAVPPQEQGPKIDLSYRFPFSLPPQHVPFARLFELFPDRYRQYQAFYDHAQRADAELRRAGSRADDMALRTISISIWSVLAAIWLAYAIVVMRSLIHP